MKRYLSAILLILIVLPGCSKKFRLSPDRISTNMSWPFHHGDLAATGAKAQGTFDGRLDIIWESGSNDKPAAPLSLQYGFLVYQGTKGRTEFFDANNGRYRGGIGSSRKTAQTGLVVLDSLCFFGTAPPRDKFFCYDLIRGRQIWSRSVKDVASGTIIVESRVVVPSTKGSLFAFDPVDGKTIWRFDSPERLVAPPAASGTMIVQPADRGLLLMIDAVKGVEIGRARLDGSLVSATPIGTAVFATLMQGTAVAIDPRHGKEIWRTSLPSRVWTSPAVAADRLIYGCSNGKVVALDKTTGRELWCYDTQEAIRASIVVVGNFAIAATLSGTVVSLRLSDGVEVARRQLKGGVDKSPVTDGQYIFVATRAGTIICLGVNDDTDRQENL